MRTTGRSLSILVLLIAAYSQSMAAQSQPPVIDRAAALKVLRTALAEHSSFVKVHAAEALIELGYADEPRRAFQTELAAHGHEPHYRTGIFRVLARAERQSESRQAYVDRLLQVYFEPANPDRVHALEALAKLAYVVPAELRPDLHRILPKEPEAEVCLLWLLAASGSEEDARSLASLLDSPNARVRGLTSYALRHLPQQLPADVLNRLADRAVMETAPEARVPSLSAAYATASTAETAAPWKPLLLNVAAAGSPAERYQIAQILAQRGAMEDVALLQEWSADSDPDVRIGAAQALLRIDRRQPPRFHLLDWLVLAGYAGGMLSIGWYFSRRAASSSDDFLLAGRSMRALPVALSYFATLFSTITYLSTPGEVIRHGPMVLGAILGLPVVYLIVGYLLIPYIMGLNVSTAYEILERRLGVSVRMLGSGIFLALRLAWMAMILFGMSRVVLVPIFGLDVSATPWLAILLATLTVAYTSMGGLKAVIWSDVIQALILMSGAILSIVAISIYLGGAAAWWPSHWASHWEAPGFWFNPTARLTVASAALSQFTWYLCTAGSDQMAVQRYLATKDATTARRMFALSLTCDAFVAILLVALGLALLAYFSARPEGLPDGVTLISGADRLFPQFIVGGLPRGISGLIIAGLTAAAMSSLSSGVSSAASVITLDWVNRFRATEMSEQAKVRVARVATWLIGVVIVALSYVAWGIEGNLLEKAFRFINLFTAPLFVLFFMSMFVPGAKVWNAWAACLASWAAAAAIAYTQMTGLSVFWIMPMSLVTGMVVGCLAALVPIGERRPMLAIKEHHATRHENVKVRR